MFRIWSLGLRDIQADLAIAGYKLLTGIPGDLSAVGKNRTASGKKTEYGMETNGICRNSGKRGGE